MNSKQKEQKDQEMLYQRMLSLTPIKQYYLFTLLLKLFLWLPAFPIKDKQKSSCKEKAALKAKNMEAALEFLM